MSILLSGPIATKCRAIRRLLIRESQLPIADHPSCIVGFFGALFVEAITANINGPHLSEMVTGRRAFSWEKIGFQNGIARKCAARFRWSTDFVIPGNVYYETQIFVLTLATKRMLTYTNISHQLPSRSSLMSVSPG